MKIPTIVKSQDGLVFFLQLSKFSHQYDANLQPIYGQTPILSWHDGFDFSFDFETILTSLIIDEEPATFEICRCESHLYFAKGSKVPYFDFCHWVDCLEDRVEFDSVNSLFSCFIKNQQIELADTYQHPSWLADILWLLNFSSARNKTITKQQIETIIKQKRATYFQHYPLSIKY